MSDDYFVHPSGLWVALRQPLSREEMLAVTYITAVGDTIGDYNAEDIFRNLTNAGTGELPVLELFKDAETHRPGGVTWDRERIKRIDEQARVWLETIRDDQPTSA